MDDDYIKGRGSQINTANPFSKSEYVTEHIEGLDEEMLVPPNRQIFFEHAKKIVNKVDSPDLSFMYSMNPYQGCEHGCIYCYARNSHEYWGFSAGLDFESKIIVKQNAAALLEKHFQNRNWQATPINLSGNTDCYQPLEREQKLTRSMLQVCLKYGNPVGIISKNSLILRDLAILKEMAAEKLVHVFSSITTLDEKLRLKMEPRTATAANRFKVLNALSGAGIPTGVMMAPIIPGLNNYEIPEVLKRAAENGALTAGYTIVRLNGSIKILFEDWLRKNFPERADKVWNQICEVHGGKVNDSEWGRRMRGDGPIADAVAQMFSAARKKYFSGRALPDFDLNKFRKNGNLTLF